MAAEGQNIHQMKQLVSWNGTAFGDVVYEPGGTCGPRLQSDVQIVALVEGECTVEVDGIPMRVVAGEVALMEPGRSEWFRFSAARRSRHTWCALPVPRAGRALVREVKAAPRRQRMSARLESLICLGLSASSCGEPEVRGALLESLAVASVRQYLADAATAREETGWPASVLAARAYAEAHLSGTLTVRAMARAGSVSPQYLIRLFRRYVGTTPADYVWDLRANQARGLIQSTGLKLGAIAERCGYSSAFHLSRAMKVRFGRSPKALRAARWAGEDADRV